MQTTKSLIGEIIRNKRQELGVAQEPLAALVGCDVATISRIERGATDPSYQTIKRLKEVLDLSGESLFQERYYGFKTEFKRCMDAWEILTRWKDGNRDTFETAKQEKLSSYLGKIKEIAKNRNVKEIFEVLEEYSKSKEYIEYLKTNKNQPRIKTGVLEKSMNAIQIELFEQAFWDGGHIGWRLESIYILIPED